jgi:23S rRNA (pseudouridine1915-N3)-methyltransferase
MKTVIAAIGKMKKNSPEALIIAGYAKRLSRDFEIREKDNSTPAAEAKFLLDSIAAGAKVVVLDERGELLSSPELAGRIGCWQTEGVASVYFLIGGADGHLPMVRERADLVLSFGRLTLPHMLMRAVLAEQIYRAETILKGHPYNR